MLEAFGSVADEAAIAGRNRYGAVIRLEVAEAGPFGVADDVAALDVGEDALQAVVLGVGPAVHAARGRASGWACIGGGCS